MTTFAQAAEFYALRGAVRALEALDWSRAGALGAWIGSIGYRPLGIRRAVVEQQIAAAFPEMSRSDVERTALAAYRHLGRNAAEIALTPRLGRQGLVDMFEQVDNWDWVEQAMAAGRGIIAVTGHVGNWELGGAYFAARGSPIDAIARRQANPLFEEYITRTRMDMGMVIVHDHEAVRRTARSLRDGRLVAFLADQGVKGLASTFVPFFGRPAKTPRGPAVFAKRLGAPVAAMAAMRLPNGRFRLHIEAIDVPDTGDRERDVDTVVANFTAALERVVRQYPEQYFWHHRRWRRQPPPG
jgi:Kdo2-lipid IVA lauroyltransferase/acyltransferase